MKSCAYAWGETKIVIRPRELRADGEPERSGHGEVEQARTSGKEFRFACGRSSLSSSADRGERMEAAEPARLRSLGSRPLAPTLEVRDVDDAHRETHERVGEAAKLGAVSDVRAAACPARKSKAVI